MRRNNAKAVLGDLQLQVMQVLWNRGSATLAEIREELSRTSPVATTTVATVISRLEKAGMVGHETGTRRVYRALLSQAETQRTQTQRLIDRLFGGRAEELLAHLVRDTRMSEGELARLRKLLQEKSK
jgi:BlaI family transcriptional regulator, penicillinase repressor